MADKALAAYRVAEQSNWPWPGMTIAKEVGYATRGTTWRTVQRALKERQFEAIDDYGALQSDNLEAIQREIWEDALAVNVKAVRTALRVIDKWCRLLGLV